MSTQLEPNNMELYKRTDEVLHYMWDPIGVAGTSMARDEYYSYLPHVFGLVRSNADAEKIAQYLLEIEVDRMGLQGDKKKCMEVAAILLDWKKTIGAKAS